MRPLSIAVSHSVLLIRQGEIDTLVAPTFDDMNAGPSHGTGQSRGCVNRCSAFPGCPCRPQLTLEQLATDLIYIPAGQAADHRPGACRAAAAAAPPHPKPGRLSAALLFRAGHVATCQEFCALPLSVTHLRPDGLTVYVSHEVDLSHASLTGHSWSCHMTLQPSNRGNCNWHRRPWRSATCSWRSSYRRSWRSRVQGSSSSSGRVRRLAPLLPAA